MSAKMVFATCMLRCDEHVISAFTTLASALKAIDTKLVVGVTDGDLLRKEGLNFETLWIPSTFAEYAPAGRFDFLSQPADDWLLSCDASWSTLSADPVTSKKGLSGCRAVADEILRTLRPSACLIWSSGNFPVSRVWHEIAWKSGIPTYCLERGLLPGTWMIDAGGLNSQSELVTHPILRAISAAHIGNSRTQQYKEWYLNTRPTKYSPNYTDAQGHQGGVERKVSGRIVLCLGGADNAGLTPRTNSGSSLNSPGFADSVELARHFDALAAANPTHTYIFKPHPFDRNRYSADMFRRATLRLDDDPIELIRNADVVICGLTTLQYEAVLLGKPLVLTARTALWGRQIAHEASGPGELARAVESALATQSPEIFQENGERFLDWLLAHALYGTASRVPARGMDELADAISILEPDMKGDVEAARRILWVRSLDQGPRLGVNSLQVFWPGRYSETRSSRHYWPADGAACTIEVTWATTDAGEIRVDPSDAPCLVILDDIQVFFDSTWHSYDFGAIKLGSQHDCSVFIDHGRLHILCLGFDPILEVGTTTKIVNGIRLIGRKFRGPLSGLVYWAWNHQLISAELLTSYLETAATMAPFEKIASESDRGAIDGVWLAWRNESDLNKKVELGLRLLAIDIASESRLNSDASDSPTIQGTPWSSGDVVEIHDSLGRLRIEAEKTFIKDLKLVRREFSELRTTLEAGFSSIGARDANVMERQISLESAARSLFQKLAETSSQVDAYKEITEGLRRTIESKDEVIRLLNASSQSSLEEHARKIEAISAERKAHETMMKAERETLLGKIQKFEDEQSGYKNEINQLRDQLKAMHQSASWRVTRPLRWTQERLKG